MKTEAMMPTANDMKEPTILLDKDMNPSADSLIYIEEYPVDKDLKSLFDFMKLLWSADDLWVEEEVEDFLGHTMKVYYISTGGQLSNELILRSFSRNIPVFFRAWVQSRRGGHYIFEVTA